MELENYFLIRSGKHDQAIANFNTLRSRFAADTATAKEALFGLWSLYFQELKDTLKSKTYLDELKTKFPKDDLTWHATILSIGIDTAFVPGGTDENLPSVKAVEPTKIELLANYPNPFNPTTSIHYKTTQSNHVTLKVYDILGRIVATLVDGHIEAGEHTTTFDASRLASGIYFYELRAGSYQSVKKMLLMK